MVNSNGDPIPGARVTVLDQDSPLTLAITDAQGQWSAAVPVDSEPHTVVSGRLSGIYYDAPACAGWYGPYSINDVALSNTSPYLVLIPLNSMHR